MDWITFRKRTEDFIRKYRYALLVLLIGLALMLIPEKITKQEKIPEQSSAQKADNQQTNVMQELTAVLSQIEGVGKVKVMLSISAGENTIYQQDEEIVTGEADSTVNRETVILTDGSRGQSALIQQVIPPKYLGAIIVCEGADRSAVRLNVIEAVSNVTGLGTDRISVLKMK